MSSVKLGWGWFIDAAYAGSRGVHLQQYSTNIDQIPDNFVAQAGAQCPGFTGGNYYDLHTVNRRASCEPLGGYYERYAYRRDAPCWAV